MINFLTKQTTPASAALKTAAFCAISCMLSLATPFESHGTEKISVYVSIPPQKQLVEKIAGDLVQTRILLPPGKNPETFSPAPRDVASLAEARVLFIIGVPFEQELIPIIRSNMKHVQIVDTSTGIEKRMLEGHSHGDGSFCHAHPDPHIWLSLPLLKKQAAIMASALSEIDPDNSSVYLRNMAGLTDKINKLHSETAEMLGPHKGKSFFVFHPSFGYLAHDYGLTQKAIESGGKSPAPKELAALIRSAKKHGVKVIFTQPQFDSRAAKTIASSIGAKTVDLDPLAEELLENIKRIAEELVKSFNAP